MRLGPVELPALAVPRLGLAAFRRRAVVHLAFLLLALATLGLVATVLTDQKQRAYQRYAQGFRQSLAEIVLQLRHPSGQLALLNPTMTPGDRAGQAPVLLPFAAIDFDDQNKAQRAVEMAGCGLRWPDGSSLCAAVGANAYAGGFLYLVGSLDSGPLVGREHGALALSGVHRMRVTLTMRGETQTWIAPFEGMAAFDRDASDGGCHAFDRQPQRPLRHRLGTQPSGLGQGAETPGHRRQIHGLMPLRTEQRRQGIGRKAAQQQVGIGDRGWAPAAVTRRARQRPGRFRAHQQATTKTAQDRTAAGRHGVHRQHRCQEVQPVEAGFGTPLPGRLAPGWVEVEHVGGGTAHVETHERGTGTHRRRRRHNRHRHHNRREMMQICNKYRMHMTMWEQAR